MDAIAPTAFRRLLKRSVFVPAALLGALALIFLGQILYLLSADRWVDHSDRVIAGARNLLKLLVDGETGLRGFLVTGEPGFLEPYEFAEGHADAAFEESLRLVADNPSQLQRLEAVRAGRAEWQAYARAMIELRRAGGDYQAGIRTREGKQRMDTMRAQIADFVRAEEELRDSRVRAVRQATWAVVAVSVGLVALLGGFLAAFTRRQLLGVATSYEKVLLEQARLREQVQRHADELERHVEERTRELQESLESVKRLQGLLPICAWCKKVRDDRDYWHEVEHYVTAHTEARFTHGICPECLRKALAKPQPKGA